jgi:hypothetical protein
VPAGTWDIAINPGQLSTMPAVHVDLIYRPTSGGDQTLASGDNTPGVALHLQPALAAIPAACGDALVIRLRVTASSVGGTRYGFDGTNVSIAMP